MLICLLLKYLAEKMLLIELKYQRLCFTLYQIEREKDNIEEIERYNTLICFMNNVDIVAI